jgi:hypothetical protein
VRPPEGFATWGEFAGCVGACIVGAVAAWLSWGVTP